MYSIADVNRLPLRDIANYYNLRSMIGYSVRDEYTLRLNYMDSNEIVNKMNTRLYRLPQFQYLYTASDDVLDDISDHANIPIHIDRLTKIYILLYISNLISSLELYNYFRENLSSVDAQLLLDSPLALIVVQYYENSLQQQFPDVQDYSGIIMPPIWNSPMIEEAQDYSTPNYPAPDYSTPNYPAPGYSTPNYPAPDYSVQDIPSHSSQNVPDYSAPNFLVPENVPNHPIIQNVPYLLNDSQTIFGTQKMEICGPLFYAKFDYDGQPIYLFGDTCCKISSNSNVASFISNWLNNNQASQINTRLYLEYPEKDHGYNNFLNIVSNVKNKICGTRSGIICNLPATVELFDIQSPGLILTDSMISIRGRRYSSDIFSPVYMKEVTDKKITDLNKSESMKMSKKYMGILIREVNAVVYLIRALLDNFNEINLLILGRMGNPVGYLEEIMKSEAHNDSIVVQYFKSRNIRSTLRQLLTSSGKKIHRIGKKLHSSELETADLVSEYFDDCIETVIGEAKKRSNEFTNWWIMSSKKGYDWIELRKRLDKLYNAMSEISICYNTLYLLLSLLSSEDIGIIYYELKYIDKVREFLEKKLGLSPIEVKDIRDNPNQCIVIQSL